MLHKIDPTLKESDPISRGAADVSKKRLQSNISQFAEQLRVTGYNEAAHFMDIAALSMHEPDSSKTR